MNFQSGVCADVENRSANFSLSAYGFFGDDLYVYSPKETLMMYLKVDDIKGNGFDGMNINAIYTEDGIANGAFSFTGYNSYVSIPYNIVNYIIVLLLFLKFRNYTILEVPLKNFLNVLIR